MSDDARPFPVQKEYRRDGKWGRKPACSVPWWLAEEAYRYYAALYGRKQSLERLAERGGFGRDELLSLLRYEDSDGMGELLKAALKAAQELRGVFLAGQLSEDGCRVLNGLLRAIQHRQDAEASKEGERA